MAPERPAMADGTPATALQDARQPAARFEGKLGDLGWLLLCNWLYSVLTLGIYRFWGRTHARRFVWRHTVLLGDTLEYLGTGRELFVGFLIAVAVLLPVFAVYTLLQFVLEDAPRSAFWLLEALYFLVLLFLIQIAIHRMRRYRLTRTAWRGVRFGLGGSSLRYACISFAYGLLTVATFGLAYPWMRAATLGYFARCANFGAAEIALAPNAGWLFRRWLAVIASLIAGVGVFTAFNTTFNPEELWSILSFIAQANTVNLVLAFDRLALSPLAALAPVPLAWVWYRTVEFRHLIACLRIGDTEFRSSFRVRFAFSQVAIFLVLLVMGIGLLILVFLLFMMFIGVAFGTNSIFLNVVIILIPVLMLLFLPGIVKTLYLDIPMLEHACETLEISNARALEEVVQSSAAVPSYGEGTAEALDVGGF